MKKHPKITIIVPIFNSANYLISCLDSIISQTYQNLEIILVNDGSTDSSPQIIQDYHHKDSRIKIINQKNQGLSGARNSGLKHTTGDYVTFVDSDDQINPKMIQAMLDALQQSSADIAVCSFKEILPDNRVKGFSHNHPKQTFTTEAALANMLQENGFMVSATMKLFPTRYFDDIKFPVGKLHEDVGITYKLIMKATKIVFIPNEYYIYMHHNDSIINQNFDHRKLDLIELTDQMCDDIDKHYPNLKNITNERRMRARFSILRQIPINDPKTKELLKYLKIHQSFIINNPMAGKTDKIALKLALTSPRLFQFAYKKFKS